MQCFQILFHGTLAGDVAEETGARRLEGFYTSRAIVSAGRDAAITRGKELIRQELEETILSGRPEVLALLEVEEVQEIQVDETVVLNRRGFTFY